MQRKGIPDLILCVAGRFIALEVKRPGGEATMPQRAQIAAIGQAGGRAAVIDSLEAAVGIVESCRHARAGSL